VPKTTRARARAATWAPVERGRRQPKGDSIHAAMEMSDGRRKPRRRVAKTGRRRALRAKIEGDRLGRRSRKAVPTLRLITTTVSDHFGCSALNKVSALCRPYRRDQAAVFGQCDCETSRPVRSMAQRSLGCWPSPMFFRQGAHAKGGLSKAEHSGIRLYSRRSCGGRSHRRHRHARRRRRTRGCCQGNRDIGLAARLYTGRPPRDTPKDFA